MITLAIMRTDEHCIYFYLVEEDYISLAQTVCVTSKNNFQATTFYLLR